MPLQIDSYTPTSINALVGDSVVMSCEVSGGSPYLHTASMAGTDYASAVYIASNGVMYRGFAYTADGIVEHSTDNGATWHIYRSFISAGYAFVWHIGENLYGDITICLSKYPGSNTNAIVVRCNNTADEIIYSSGDTAALDIVFWCHQFADGTYVLGTDMGNGGGGFRIKKRLLDNSWVDMDKGALTGDIRYEESWQYCKISDNSILVGVSLGLLVTPVYVCVVTPTSCTPVAIGSTGSSKTIVGRLHDGRLVAQSMGNPSVMRQSTDNGSTWSSFVGTIPSPTRTKSNLFTDDTGVTWISDRSFPMVYRSFDHGSTWTTHNLTGGGVSSVVAKSGIALIGYRNSIGGTTTAGNFDVITYTKSLIDTSDNSVISTVFPYTYTADLADDNKNFRWIATDGVSTVKSVLIPVSVTTPLQLSINPTSINALVGDSVVMSCETTGGSGTIIKKLIDTFDSSVLSLVSPFNYLADFADNGHIFKWEVSDDVTTIFSDPIPVTVASSFVCDDSMIRYLFEMSARELWEPSLSTSINYSSHVGVISFFMSGSQISSYWTDWGGSYDNTKTKRFELFFKQYLTPVNSINELLLTPFSVFQSGDKTFVNTAIYPWQYSRFYSFIASIFGFSSAVRDSGKPSDDTFDGIRYPVRLQVPSLGLSQLPDPVSGVITLPAFSVSLENSDGYFDLFDTRKFFNSLVRLKKSTVSRPTISDYKTIRTAYVDTVDVTFSEYRVKSFEPTRAFSQEGCSVFVENQFSNMDPDIIGESIPIGYGPIKGCKLIEISSYGNAFRYIAIDPKYLTSVSTVYDSNGPISHTLSDGVITTFVEAERADIIGRLPCTIADIVVSEISEKADQSFVPGVWDISEVERYRAISPEISLYFEKGNLKKLIEDAVKNDSAFVFTKNSGELTIRRFGLTYEYHEIAGWKTTQQPMKSFSESKDFCSSTVVDYLYDFDVSETTKTYLYDDKEDSVFDIYTKMNRRRFSTSIVDRVFAEDLAIRQFSRFSKRFEMIKIATGYDCSEINPLDTVKMPISVNGRMFTANDTWIVRACDPAQDKLDLEEASPVESFIGGSMSFPSISDQSGIMSHLSVGGGISGEMVFPSISKGK